MTQPFRPGHLPRLARGGLPAALAAALLAGCGGFGSHTAAPGTGTGATGSPQATATTSAPTPTPSTATTTSATTAAPAGTAAGPAHCTAAQLSFTAAGGQGAAGTINVGIRVTNTGSAACWTFGYVGLQLISASGVPLATTVLRGTASPFQGPLSTDLRTVAHRVTLAPGAWGWFDLAYSDVTSDQCPAGPAPAAKIAIIAPDTTQPRTVALSSRACGGRLGVSPVLPASTWTQ